MKIVNLTKIIYELNLLKDKGVIEIAVDGKWVGADGKELETIMSLVYKCSKNFYFEK